MGQVKRYETAEEMQKVINLYFLSCKMHLSNNPELIMELSIDELRIIDDIDCKYPTVVGLALALGIDRKTLLDYGTLESHVDYHPTIKMAKLKIEAATAQRLFENNPTGSIFNLKNNFGWKDKSETELSTPDGKPFQIETKNRTDDELDARILELTQKTTPSKDKG